MLGKKRTSALPEDNKKIIIGSLRCVDEVVCSSDLDPVFDFVQHIDRIKPDILAVTEDDRNAAVKKEFCSARGIQLVILPKTTGVTQTSTTAIRAKVKGE
jgi:glycerol-3-phosphate cytidylyltransferase-like family protein